MVMANMRDKRFIQIVLWVVIAAFIGTIFIAWGMKSYGDKTGVTDPNTAASVGDQKVSYDQFYKAAESYNDTLEAAGCQASSPEYRQVRRKVLDSLINQAILRETAQKMGLQVSKEEIIANIMREQAFQDQNRKFDKEQYVRVLEANNLTPDQFESGLRENLINQRIRGILDESVIYTPSELQRFGDLLNRELRAKYVALDQTAFEKAVKVDADSLRRYFEDNQDRYNKPERAKLRHILLATKGEIAADMVTLTQKAEDLRKQLAAKKLTFTEAAKQYSQDPGTKDKGGELGWVQRGMMVEPFEVAAFRLAKGEISKPVTTQFGVHLIQLEDYDKGSKAVLANIRAQVEKEYRASEGSKKMQGLLLRLALRLEDGKKLADAATELGLKVQETAWFTRASGLKEWKDSKYAADSLLEKQLGEWEGPLRIGKNSVVFEISEEKNIAAKPEQLLKQQAELQSRYTALLKDRWMKDFYENQRAKLKIKINARDEATGEKR